MRETGVATAHATYVVHWDSFILILRSNVCQRLRPILQISPFLFVGSERIAITLL